MRADRGSVPSLDDYVASDDWNDVGGGRPTVDEHGIRVHAETRPRP